VVIDFLVNFRNHICFLWIDDQLNYIKVYEIEFCRLKSNPQK